MTITKQLVALGLIAGLTLPAFAGETEINHEDNDQKIALTSTPSAVQATISANLAKGTVIAVEQETEDGVTQYEAKIKLPDGKELELVVAADGKLIKSEIESEDGEGGHEGAKQE